MAINGSGSFWSVISIVAAAIGSIFFLFVTHTGTATHPGAAPESAVIELKVGFEGISTDVENNKIVLSEVKQDIKELRVEQRVNTESILRAIGEIR